MIKAPFLYLRPMIFAAAIMAAALALFLRGKHVTGTGDMDGFGLMFLGGFLAIVSIITAAVYASMQFKFRKALGEPLLAFRSEIREHDQAVEKTISQIKGANLITLVTVLIFCVLIAIIGPLVVEDGYIFSLIALGIAVFTALAALIVTKYRSGKLRRAARDVVLSRNGVYVAGEFHSWSGFTSQLTDIEFIPPLDGKPAQISGTYRMLGAYRSNEAYFNLPVPESYLEQAEAVVEIIKETNQ